MVKRCPRCGKALELKADFIGWWAECVCGYEDWICPIKVSHSVAHQMFLAQEFTLPEVSLEDTPLKGKFEKHSSGIENNIC